MQAVRRLSSVQRQFAITPKNVRNFGSGAANMAKLDINSKYKMLSGFEIPVLGYGVYKTPADVTEEVTLEAFKVGYRHVDSARAYRNEAPCADAIRKSDLKREDIFFTTKVPPGSMGYEGTKKSIADSFAETGLDYIDLYLIHSPYGGPEARKGTWRALVEAQQAGKIRSIGVSNYGVHHLDELENYIKELEAKNGKGKGGEISIGQYELHPWLGRSDIVEWCEERGVLLEAYCPLVRNTRSDEPVLLKLAKKYNKTPAQVLVRWSLQKGFLPLPKSVTHSRISENAAVYDFELTKDDEATLTTKDYSPCAWDPTVSTLKD